MRRTAALLFLLLTTISAGARAQALDWRALNDEALHTLTDYIRVNTTDPPGNELDAAHFLKKILDKEGIEATIYDTTVIGPNRANLYARLKGNGSKKAVALVSHMDVVPVAPSFWSVDPFSGIVKDGYIWGRGTLDMKGQAVVQLMAMIALKRSGVPLNRDIVFIGNADEEFGGDGGVEFVKNHADLLKDVEFLMTEGGENLVVNGKLRVLRRGRLREADVLAEDRRDGRAVARIASDETESGSAARGRARPHREVRNAAACAPRRAEIPARHLAAVHGRAARVARRRAPRRENPARAQVADGQHLLERDPSKHDLAHDAAGIEQDERHSGRGVGADGHPAAVRHRSAHLPEHPEGDRERHGGALGESDRAEDEAPEPDRHGSLPRDREGRRTSAIRT